MTKRELWLKLFSENNTALAAAIHLCQRFVTPMCLESGNAFLNQKRCELNEEVAPEVVLEIFQDYQA